MRDLSRLRSSLGLVVVLGAALALSSVPAEAHGRRGGHGGRVVIGGFYGFSPWGGYSPYWGWGWGWGLYPPAYYQPEGGGVTLGQAMMAGFGAVDLNVKPNRADVWVDGKYVGEARDLDGYPSYLWLPEGEHRLAVYKGGYLTFEEPINVQRGMKTELKIKLQPGESRPPGPKPGEGETNAGNTIEKGK